ncbi:hydroxyisourate hydrolase [Amylibacter sp.]|nr:hydroxyisourate hydrolase [Amylibacter sp.]
MAGYLTTHVLDTARGCPAEGLRIELYKIVKDSRNFLSEALTNDDGRTDKQILSSAEFEIGEYELLFHCGDYIARNNQVSEGVQFLNIVPIRFGMSENLHYHVPLLLSPYGYSTYRGS